ncbi:MAG: hypothetical protein A2358_01565 [Candidatus Staskawiczbacteria bacterium RIFOXYB1_FULL_37_44]|uniref:Polysaccharide chain length determinant N-terminal domain-containing protein n=1 Tax=Candidatus Staskawiczbacteria bacterium RIFOXYB1_FULL_37_44 TaxID=1802223 RepID=A0A1G2IXP9_9BACT|nr:MAG: hypothetical protein A2358_01565 [Candidatus Staskawiczbacteria bacterium RIFOXYB1_FULL_37_44]OGZ83394.1 MAG: hypothetical protein A2416_02300 [Candidatus Staskawiczbacteria bacterium RIFOXYC1_FULL_37_52]OGZ88797.1 MAG: hypothetical protein A2581_03240 [Candidatus Staskawiczbacteria bacterium RIFOXYD1_FULL_37_110]
MENNTEELNMIDFLKVLIKNKYIIISFLILGIIFAIAITFLTPKTYVAEAVVDIGATQIENLNRIVIEENLNYSKKYPSLKVAAILNSNLINVKNYSSNQDKVSGTVLDAASGIVSDCENILEAKKNNLEATIKSYETAITQLMQSGQQIAALKLKEFELQNELENFRSPVIANGPIVSEVKGINVLFSLIIGTVLGVFLGIITAFAKEWWNKNKVLVKIKNNSWVKK